MNHAAKISILSTLVPGDLHLHLRARLQKPTQPTGEQASAEPRADA